MRHLVSVIIIGSFLIIACNRVTQDNKAKNHMEQEAILVIKKLHKAMNEHNLDAMIDCVDPDYISEQPFYPARNFVGQEQMRNNWTQIWSDYPDFASNLKRYSVSNDTIWLEWHWTGTQDTTHLNVVGVAIFKIKERRIINGRLFMNPVE